MDGADCRQWSIAPPLRNRPIDEARKGGNRSVFESAKKSVGGVQIRNSLYGLSSAHRFDEAFEGLEVTLLNELDRSLVLKLSVRRMEEDAGALLVTGVEFHDGHPNPVNTSEFRLQTTCIRMLANARSFLPDGLSNR